MNLKFASRILAFLSMILLCESPLVGQTMLSKLSEKKLLWRAIVDKKIVGVKGWNAGFPTEREVDRNDPNTFGVGGDTLMYNALLCGVGENASCGVIPDSIEDSGQLRRNPLLKYQPSGSKYGPLSKDHSMATLYWLSLKSVPEDVRKNFAIKWQQSFNQPVVAAGQCAEKIPFCLTGGVDPIDNALLNTPYDLSDFLPGQPQRFNLSMPKLSVDDLKGFSADEVKKAAQSTVDAVGKQLDKVGAAVSKCAANDKACLDSWKSRIQGTLDTIKAYAEKGADELQSCLSSGKDVAKCVKTNAQGAINYEKGILVAYANCAEGLAQGRNVVARCIVNLLTAYFGLNTFCSDFNCVFPPNQMAYINRIWKDLGLTPPFYSVVFDALGADSEETALASAEFGDMNTANLVAMTILVRRNLTMKTSGLLSRLNKKQPNNPFFMSLDSANTKEALAGLVIKQCASIESLRLDKNNNLVPQYLSDDLKSYWRWKTPEQNEFEVDGNNMAESISLVWDCIFMADALGVKEAPALTAVSQLPFTIRVRRNENPTVYETVARGISGGVSPVTYELLSKPTEYTEFSFDPATGTFIFRPVNSYFGGSFRFAATDKTGKRVESTATIAFDHSEIYPGHPPLSRPPETPLPANINPLFTITHLESGQLRTLTDITLDPADTLVVPSGSLQIEAEAYIENVDENYTGVLDCTLDWTGKAGAPTLIKDTDEYPRNFRVQQTIQAQSLEPYELSRVRMTCMAPDMPIVVRDIPLLYTPEAPALKKPLDQNEYVYASNSGATLKLVLNKNASDSFNRTYSYTLSSVDCGQKTGNMVAAINANKLTVDGSFNGFLTNGDAQKMVWIDAQVCGKFAPVVWKLQSSKGGSSSGPVNTGCNLKAYPTKDGTSLAKPSSFDSDMNQCGKAVAPANWSCSWVSADKTWIIPELKSVVFTADRWGTTKFNIFSYDTVKRSGCVDPEVLLKPQTNSCNLSGKGYKNTDSTGNTKPASFVNDMAQCGAKVKATDWACTWVSADETWVIPSQKTVIFTANRWGADKYNVFSFDTVRRSGCKNPESFR